MKTHQQIQRAFVFIAIAFLYACGQKPEEKTVEEKMSDAKEIEKPANTTLENLSASFLIALKENNYNAIEQFLPLKEDIGKIVTIYEGTEKEKKEILAGAEENAKKIRENTHKSFEEILKKGIDAGINWQESIFSNAEYILKKENNIETAALAIIFNYKGLRYKITIEECIHTEKGWLIFDKPKWNG